MLKRLVLFASFILCGCLFRFIVCQWSSAPYPETVFQEVMGKPLTAGVTNLVVVQRQSFVKRWAWVRFEATDKAIASLVHSDNLVVEPFNRQIALQGKRGVASNWHEAEDRRTIGWEQVFRIKRPEIYQVSSYSDDFNWVGYFIVDRKCHLAYAEASGD